MNAPVNQSPKPLTETSLRTKAARLHMILTALIAVFGLSITCKADFVYDHSESALRVNTFVFYGPTENVGVGDVRLINVDVRLETWEVWINEYNDTQIVNLNSAFAPGAGLSWGVTGDASVGTHDLNADSSGSGFATFYMGTVNLKLYVNVSFGTLTGYAEVPFTTP